MYILNPQPQGFKLKKVGQIALSLFLWNNKMQENNKLIYVTMSKKWDYHSAETTKIKKSKVVWETFKCIRIRDEIEEEKNSKSKLKFL